MFANPEVDLDSLPRAEAVDWQPLHPRFVRCRQVRRLVVCVVLLVALAVAYVLAAERGLEIAPWAMALAVGGGVLIAVWYLLWPVLEVPKRGYALRDKDIVYRAGLLWRSVQVVPFNRVQHASTDSGPLERRFGLAALTVFTAGGSGGDLQIAGLGEQLAENLRAYIVGKLGSDGGEREVDAAE